MVTPFFPYRCLQYSLQFLPRLFHCCCFPPFLQHNVFKKLIIKLVVFNGFESAGIIEAVEKPSK